MIDKLQENIEVQFFTLNQDTKNIIGKLFELICSNKVRSFLIGP